ncbi:ABC-three component system middle component 2 [Acinetobacter sp. ANC 5502]
MSDIFNTSLELGVRMVYLLGALYPRGADIHKLVYLDYAVIYSSDFGGPSSLHTLVPFRWGEFTNKKDALEDGIVLMLNRSLIDVIIDDDGINYYIGDNGPSIISVMNNEYSKKLINRCEWVAKTFGSYSEDELRNVFFNESIVTGSDASVLNHLGN